MNLNLYFKNNHLNYFFSFVLLILLIFRSSVIKDIIPNYIFYSYIIFLNFYLFFSDKIIVNKSGLFLYVICIFSFTFSYIFGWINPILNSSYRLVLFILMFNIVGPFLNNNTSISFRIILYNSLLISIPFIFLIDCFYILYFRRLTFGGHAEGFLESPNLSGVIAALNILLFLIYFIRNQKVISKLFYLIYILFGILILLSSASRSAILALLICSLFLLYFNVKKFSIALIFFFFIGFLFFDYVEPFYQILISKIETRNNSGDITAGRANMFQDNFSDFKKNPIFGVGFYNMYNTTNSKINDDGSLEYPSGWLFILSTTGLLGLLYFIYILRYYFFYFFNMSIIKSNILIFSFLTFFLVHSNFEGYIYSAGGLLFYIFWLCISSFNDKYMNK